MTERESSGHGPGRPGTPSVQVRWCAGDGAELHRTKLGAAAVEKDRILTLVRAPETLQGWAVLTDDERVVPLPPEDEGTSDWSNLHEISGATARWVNRYTSCAVIESLDVLTVVTDGIPRHVTCMPPTDEHLNSADAWFQYPLARKLRRRRSEGTTIGLMSPPAQLGGDIDVAMMVAGLVDDRWMKAAALQGPVLDTFILTLHHLDGSTLEPPTVRQ